MSALMDVPPINFLPRIPFMYSEERVKLPIIRLDCARVGQRIIAWHCASLGSISMTCSPEQDTSCIQELSDGI